MWRGLLLVAAGACAAITARAEDPDVVTLYGRVYALLESVEVRGDSAPALRRARLTDQSSYLGVRGQHDLGGGLFATFQMETGFAIDSPGSFATRDSGVGLRGPWGAVVLGRWESAFTATQVGVADPFGDQGLPGIRGAAVNQGNYARRERNVVQYLSPRVAGWRARVDYATNEGRTASANPYDYAASLSYLDAHMYAGLAFEKHKDQVGTTPAAGSDGDGLGIAANRHFGPLRILVQYGRYRRTGALTQQSYLIGFVFTHDVHQILGTYQASRDGDATSASMQPRCHLVGAGYRYRFSVRTFAMAQYARVENKVGALCNFGANAVAITAEQDLSGWAVGVRTVF